MGRRTGRPPKPTALKILQGNPGKRVLPKNEPKPTGKAVCPEWVCDPGKELWARLAPGLEHDGLLTARDAEEFATYCHERAIYALYSELLKELKPKSTKVERYRAIAIKAQRLAERTGAKFGMTPSDRVGLSVPEKPANKDEEFLFGRRHQA